MSWIKSIWSELIGLFIDDGSFAIAIFLWLCGCWLVLPHLDATSVLPPAILFAGLVVILAESALRLARSGFVEKSMRPLAAIANERLLRLHFSQFRSLPIKNNTDTIVLPSTVVTTQGENGLPPSGAGADFSFASSDFKTLGAFFCNFPSLDWRRLQSRRRVGQRERRAGAGEAARLDRLSVRRAGEASEILSRFRAISMLCEAENFPSGLRARRIRQRSCGSRPERTVSPRARYQMLWLPGFRATTISGRGFNLFKPLRRHFRATPSCRLGKKFVDRLGTDSEARKKAKAPQPLIRRLEARRDARCGFDGGHRRFWMAGLL